MLVIESTSNDWLDAIRKGIELCIESPIVTIALQDTIRAAGFNVGTAKVIKLPSGDPAYHIDATDTTTGEKWTVHGPTEYAATVELARQIGFDLEG